MQSTKLKVADVELDVFDSGHVDSGHLDSNQGSGKTRPILFLHGGGGFDQRQPFVAPLAKARRIVVPTHPGFGKSSLPDWLDTAIRSTPGT